MRQTLVLPITEHKDPATGIACPLGRQFRITEKPAKMGNGTITSKYKAIAEAAVFWKPGGAESGLTADINTGRVRPRLVVSTWQTEEEVGPTGEEPKGKYELARREWYIAQARSPGRLIPVHHIIGEMGEHWTSEEITNWGCQLFEPKKMAELQSAYERVFSLNWGNIREAEVLKPITVKLAKFEKSGDSRSEVLRLRLKRARTELGLIKRIGRLVAVGKIDEAEKLHINFELVAEQYNQKVPDVELFEIVEV